MRKLSRQQLAATVRVELARQGGQCPLCQRLLDPTEAGSAVMDHNHITGECRGVLCRGCNGAEGKVRNIVATYGKAGHSSDAAVQAWLGRLLGYLQKPGLGYIYPTHKSAEETAEKARLKRNKQARERRASAQARERIKEINNA